MAEANLTSSGSGTMAESEVTGMKETLLAQQQLLQKLYAELDEEREASATAASEALDMILRLQGEKAALKMEAHQYERMADEKIEHAETTLEIFEELMFQKDMEIASLENQVQAYKRKLVSLGSDPNLTESELEESNNNNTDENQHQNPENNNESVRRLNSLPPLPANKNNFRAVGKKRERSQSPHHHQTEMIQTMEEEKTEKRPSPSSSSVQPSNTVESTHETLDSYWEEIKKLNEKVKEISDCKDIEGPRGPNLRIRRHRSCSLLYPSRGKSKTITSSIISSSSDQALQQQRRGEAAITDPSCSVNVVHDVFEVPQPAGDDNNAKAEALFRYDSAKLMGILSTNMETKLHNNKKITNMLNRKIEEGTASSVECNGEVAAEFLLLSKRIERLEERERVSSSKQEIITRIEGDGEEQLRLLKEILRQLKSMREEIIVSSEAKQSPPKEEDEDGVLDPPNEEPAFSSIQLQPEDIRFFPLI